MILAEQFSEPLTYHGEGAVWSATWAALRCVDMFAGDILQFTARGEASRHHIGTLAAMIRPTADPTVSVIAREHDVVLWNESTDAIEVLASALAKEGTRLNEGGCTPQGNLLIGSVAAGAQPGGGQLLHVAASGATNVVLPSVTVSNGIGYSPDGTRAYYADSPTRRVDILTVTESGALIERRPFASLAPSVGAPDGLWVDEDGGVWVAVFGGGRVQRYRADGTMDDAVHVPAQQVTSCTFGGPDLSTLYLTTSRENLPDDADPLAGSVFSAAVGIRGLPVAPFGPRGTS